MRQSLVWTVVLSLAALSGRAEAQADDDLKVVKKAVGKSSAPSRVTRIPPASPEAPDAVAKAQPVDPPPPAVSSAARKEPLWFKVRIVEKGPHGSRVTINLPLKLVRTLGDDWPLEWEECKVRGRECPRLSEILRTLSAGEDLVEIVDEDTTVRVWVE